jgi:hypothetical protein
LNSTLGSASTSPTSPSSVSSGSLPSSAILAHKPYTIEQTTLSYIFRAHLALVIHLSRASRVQHHQRCIASERKNTPRSNCPSSERLPFAPQRKRIEGAPKSRHANTFAGGCNTGATSQDGSVKETRCNYRIAAYEACVRVAYHGHYACLFCQDKDANFTIVFEGATFFWRKKCKKETKRRGLQGPVGLLH